MAKQHFSKNAKKKMVPLKQLTVIINDLTEATHSSLLH